MDNKSPEIKLKSEKAKKLENFWFYHKWKVIIAAFVLVVIVIGSLQVCENSKTDVSVMYAGPYATRDPRPFMSALNAAMPKDFNGDGDKNVDLAVFTILSEAQIKELEATTYEDGTPVRVDAASRNLYKEQYDLFNDHIVLGSYSVCLLDPWLYDEVNEAGGFASLKDVLGEKPSYARDDNSVYLKDTEFGQYYNEVLNLPDDTVLCVRKMSTVTSWFNKKSTEEQYQKSLEMFRAIIEFEAPKD